MANDQSTPPTQSNDQQLSFGEKAVGLSFNPGNNPKVDELKKAAAHFIDLCNDLRASSDTAKPDADVARMASVAITEAQTAQMWAVKAATWQS